MSSVIERERLGLAGNLSIRFPTFESSPIVMSSSDDGCLLMGENLIEYGLYVKKKLPLTHGALSEWADTQCLEHDSFDSRSLIYGAPFDLVLIPFEKQVHFNDRLELASDRLWAPARKYLEERKGHSFFPYSNLRFREQAYGELRGSRTLLTPP